MLIQGVPSEAGTEPPKRYATRFAEDTDPAFLERIWPNSVFHPWNKADARNPLKDG
jgi:hypothetical protein